MSIAEQVKKSSNELFFCNYSFCGWSPKVSSDLIIGLQVSICKDCVEIAAKELDLIEE